MMTTDDEDLNQCATCCAYFVDIARGSSRHFQCSPHPTLKSYDWPRMDNNYYCVICGEMTETTPDLCKHLVEHSTRDLATLGYSKRLLQAYALRILAGHKVNMNATGVNNPRPNRVPTLHKLVT